MRVTTQPPNSPWLLWPAPSLWRMRVTTQPLNFISRHISSLAPSSPHMNQACLPGLVCPVKSTNWFPMTITGGTYIIIVTMAGQGRGGGMLPQHRSKLPKYRYLAITIYQGRPYVVQQVRVSIKLSPHISREDWKYELSHLRFLFLNQIPSFSNFWGPLSPPPPTLLITTPLTINYGVGRTSAQYWLNFSCFLGPFLMKYLEDSSKYQTYFQTYCKLPHRSLQCINLNISLSYVVFISHLVNLFHVIFVTTSTDVVHT